MLGKEVQYKVGRTGKFVLYVSVSSVMYQWSHGYLRRMFSVNVLINIFFKDSYEISKKINFRFSLVARIPVYIFWKDGHQKS